MAEHQVDKSYLDPKEAIKIISHFLGDEWQLGDDQIKITNVPAHSHKHWKIERLTPGGLSPKIVMIRKFTPAHIGGLTVGFQNPASLAVIYHMMNQLGFGPALIGAFPGGQIEEYIDSHCLTPSEVSDKQISRDIARNLARIHSVKTTLAPKINHLDKFKHNYIRFLNNDQDDKIKFPDREDKLTYYTQIDWLAEVDWLKEKFEQFKCRKTTINFDVNFRNVLIKHQDQDKNQNQDKNQDKDQLKIMIIDYEYMSYNYRAIDLGGHFLYWCNTTGDLLDGIDLATDNQIREFLIAYQDEVKRLQSYPDFDQNGIDSLEHLFLETKLGLLAYITVPVMFALETANDKWPGIADVIKFWIPKYKEIKADYRNWAGKVKV